MRKWKKIVKGSTRNAGQNGFDHSKFASWWRRCGDELGKFFFIFLIWDSVIILEISMGIFDICRFIYIKKRSFRQHPEPFAPGLQAFQIWQRTNTPTRSKWPEWSGKLRHSVDHLINCIYLNKDELLLILIEFQDDYDLFEAWWTCHFSQCIPQQHLSRYSLVSRFSYETKKIN